MSDTAPGTDLVLSEDFIEKFPALNPDDNVMELLAENLGEDASDVTLGIGDFTRVKVPSGGATTWEVPTGDGDETDSTKELEGVIVFYTGRRSYWPGNQPTGEPPSCKSNDLKIGVGQFGPGSKDNPTGACESCPMSQRGSANTGTNASACKEQKLAFLLREGDVLPIMVTIPAGSLGAFRKYGIHVATSKKTKYYAIRTKLKLAKATNDAGQDYAQIVFNPGEKLTGDEAKAVAAYGKSLGSMVRENMDQLGDVADGVVDPDVITMSAEDEPVDYDENDIPADDVPVGTSPGR